MNPPQTDLSDRRFLLRSLLESLELATAEAILFADLEAPLFAKGLRGWQVMWAKFAAFLQAEADRTAAVEVDR